MKKLFIILLSLVSIAGYSQVVNVGVTANDGTGDSWRNAFIKINNQFGADSLKWRQDIADSLAAAGLSGLDTTSLSNRIDLKAPLASPTFTGVVTVPTPSNATDAATKGYVDLQQSFSTVWQDPVEDIVSTLANGITINLRYILSTDSHIYTSDGDNTWTDLGATTQGTAVYVKADGAVPTNSVGPYNYNGTSWVSIGTGSNHNDLTAIQGGASNDYYHLTSAQHTVVNQAATSSVNGYLSSTDWSTFNGKLSPTGSAAGLTGFPTLNQNTTGSAASLLNSRTIYGNSFNGTQSLTQTIGSAFGGTNNAYFAVSGPATSIKTFTFPNANATIARTDAAQTFSGYQTFSDRVYLDTYNYLLGSGSSSVSLVSTFPSATQMDFTLGTTSAGLNFGGLNGKISWDVNKVQIMAYSSSIYWDGVLGNFRTATDTTAYLSVVRTADNLRLLKSDSSSTAPAKYVTGKMLADGLATKATNQAIHDSLDNITIGMNLTTGATKNVVITDDDSLAFEYKPAATIYDADYYVATWGSDANAGTYAAPWATWDYAIKNAVAGDTVYIRGGTYYPTALAGAEGATAENINGTLANPISIWNYPGEVPILDCSVLNGTGTNTGLTLMNCDYWHLKGLSVTGISQHSQDVFCMAIYLRNGAYNTIENCNAYDNEAIGFYIRDELNTTITNCDGYDNYAVHSGGGDSDGIEIRNTVRANTTTLTGCRMWHNADDGFDLWKYEGIIIFNDCWSMNNGYDAGNGSGFKLGETDSTYLTSVQRVLNNCIATGNSHNGIGQNLGLTNMNFFNNISYHNGTTGFRFQNATTAITTFRNNISYDNGEADYFLSNAVTDHNSWNASPTVTVSDADFVSLDTLELRLPRKSDNSLPDVDCFKLVSSSDLVDAGVSVGLQYSGLKPDISNFESDASSSGSIPLFVFGAGGGNATDTLAFTTSTIYGSFYNYGSDTLVITNLKAFMVHGVGLDTLTVDVMWNDTLSSTVATKLNTTPLAIGRVSGVNHALTDGQADVSFNNAKIPPNVIVWMTTPGLAVARKPTYLNVTLSGYRK